MKERIIWQNSPSSQDCDFWYEDAQQNLNVQIDGCIVAFAELGLWDGKHKGAQALSSNINSIFNAICGDYTKVYCDTYNVRCTDTHHDGTNTILYRVAKDKESAEKLAMKVAYEGMTEEAFRKATRSLRPFVAKIYGW